MNSHPKIKIGARSLWELYYRLARKESYSYATQDQLAEMLGASVRSIRTYTNTLESAGVIRVEQDGWDRRNRIFVLEAPYGKQAAHPAKSAASSGKPRRIHPAKSAGPLKGTEDRSQHEDQTAAAAAAMGDEAVDDEADTELEGRLRLLADAGIDGKLLKTLARGRTVSEIRAAIEIADKRAEKREVGAGLVPFLLGWDDGALGPVRTDVARLAGEIQAKNADRERELRERAEAAAHRRVVDAIDIDAIRHRYPEAFALLGHRNRNGEPLFSGSNPFERDSPCDHPDLTSLDDDHREAISRYFRRQRAA